MTVRRRANPWPFTKPKPQRTSSHQPTRREMQEQIHNADRRVERAIARLQKANPGTYAHEEAVRLARLADRHMHEVEAKAFRLYGIEPEQRSFVAALFRRPSRAERHSSRMGLGELLFGVEQRERARRTTQRSTTSRATAKTRAYEAKAEQPTPRTRASRAKAAPVDQSEFERLRREVEAGTLRGEALRDFINRFGTTKKKNG